MSLHDITPSLKNVAQAVYCHNPSPFQKVKLSDLFDQPKLFFFTIFYKYLYSINIKKNKFVIVQQMWIKNAFVKEFSLISDKIIVAPPKVPKKSYKKLEFKSNSSIKSKFVFFYPTLSRPFKNIEVICEAANLLITNGVDDFEIIITVNGTENNYSKRIVEKYSYIKNINFIGRISREEVYSYYSVTDCLLFPSKLETWGLPISEFKQFDKPIILSDLPYAKETGGDYDKLKFFNPDSKNELFECIKDLITGEIEFDLSKQINKSGIVVNDWGDLFLKIIR